MFDETLKDGLFMVICAVIFGIEKSRNFSEIIFEKDFKPKSSFPTLKILKIIPKHSPKGHESIVTSSKTI